MEESSSGQERNDREEIRDYEQCGCQIGCGRCKAGRFAIPSMNCCNNTKVALAFLSFGIFLQGVIVNGISGVVISSLEKRFHLRSSETGFIASCYEIGVCVAIPIVTYVGGRGHKPLWTAWGLSIMGFGSIVFALPHFVAPKYSLPDTDVFICQANATSCDGSGLRSYRGFFIVGQILLGFGASPLYTLVLNFIDENVKQVYSSTYHGIFLASALLGPGAGFLLGGYFLDNFVNSGENVSITPLSPFWIGNWWIGFLIFGALAILTSIPIQMYPKQIPFTDKVRLDRETEMQRQKDAIKIKGDENFGKGIHDAPRSLLIVLKNPTLVLISISGSMDSGIVSALSSFGAKYIEYMFSVSSSAAGIGFGAAIVASACTGILISGGLVTKLKMKIPTMIRFSIICQICSFACMFALLINCPTPDVAGVNVPFNLETRINCNSTCSGCSTEYFSPICGADNLTYVSFCDAKCVQEDELKIANCSRIADHNNITSFENATASLGPCKLGDCPPVALFLAFGGLFTFFSYLQSQPDVQISLRCLPFYQRPFGFGVQWLIIRIVGQIPFPLILGRILDLSCILWGEECGECGACQMYDRPSMAKYLSALCLSAKAVSIICLVSVFFVYKPIGNEDDGSIEEVAKREGDGRGMENKGFRQEPEGSNQE